MLENLQSELHRAINHLKMELSKLQVGRANPSIVEDILVTAYGSLSPIKNIAAVSTLDQQTLSIQPWDKSIIRDIDKAITEAHLGLNPQNNGESILIRIPTPTEERRRELVKHANAIGEETKISLRTIRQEHKKKIDSAKSEKTISEDLAKNHESNLQKAIDESIKEVESIVKGKEEEIMKV